MGFRLVQFGYHSTNCYSLTFTQLPTMDFYTSTSKGRNELYCKKVPVEQIVPFYTSKKVALYTSGEDSSCYAWCL